MTRRTVDDKRMEPMNDFAYEEKSSIICFFHNDMLRAKNMASLHNTKTINQPVARRVSFGLSDVPAWTWTSWLFFAHWAAFVSLPCLITAAKATSCPKHRETIEYLLVVAS
jgi:hypothetical protein